MNKTEEALRKEIKEHPKSVVARAYRLGQEESKGLSSDIEDEGKAIARQLGDGIRYEGPQMLHGRLYAHVFTDVAVTGTTFLANTFEEAKQSLAEKRNEFAAASSSCLPLAHARKQRGTYTVFSW